MLTVVETPEFIVRAERLMTVEEKSALINRMAASPASGDLIPGTGGARKLRLAGRRKGKSGGFRVITFFHNWGMPVFLLDIYGKNERIDLTEAEKNELRAVLKAIVDHYRKSRKNT
ncbi:MAG: type II toxin-antitoxin system RelE/ParE family toxin [Deltaproteobacteria bacterium]|nr:type II toxin-antitoxin system RelE/ParE family toxin [Deltaproteobacteria bacterium]